MIAPAEPSGALVTHTTDTVPPAERLAYWRENTMRRLSPVGEAPAAGTFRARLNRIQGHCAELVDVVSDAWSADRDAERCRRDGYEDVSFELMAAGEGTVVSTAGEQRLRAGCLSVVDAGRPLQIARSRHRNISLIIGRDVLGGNLKALTGFPFRLQTQGLASLLKSHMRLTADQAADLTPEQRLLAIRVATDLAIAVLQTEATGAFDTEQLAAGFYECAKTLIERECTDPEFGPLQVAAVLNCSRSALYRAFAVRGETVAAAIWTARIERARAILTSPAYSGISIGEIAFRSGFVDHPTFNRMFKRRYGMTPQEMRQGR